MMLTRLLRGTVAMLLLVSGGALTIATPATPAAAYQTSTVPLSGHGWGHGRGMGQWGAYGYATSGQFFWNWFQILDHFYVNAARSTQPGGPITVRLMAREGIDLIVQAGVGGMTIDGVVLGQGDAVRLTNDNGGWRVFTRHGCNDVDGWTSFVSDPTIVPGITDPGTDVTKMLSLCNVSGGTTQYRGSLRLVNASGLHTVNIVDMEDYLRGVVPRESPASWGDAAGGHGMNALYAQAVAARSYAWAENRTAYAKTCDTTACQVYGGAGQNGTRIEDSRTDGAVGATTGVVMRMASDGSIARTEFSSSSGGYTAGGTFAAVPDDGDVASPYHNWTASLSVSDIQNAYGVGTLNSIAVTARNGLGADGGRVLSTTISGSNGSVTVTGNAFQAAWGLRSNWFSFTGQPAALQWFLRDTPDPGNVTANFLYGQPGDVPIACDWFRQGFDTPGVFRNGLWLLSASKNGSTIDASFRYGDPGDVPLCGDWDGDGVDTVAVWRQGLFCLNNQNDSSAPEGVFRFGNPTDRPIAGNWNPDPWDSVGVVRAGVFYLANSNLLPTADIVFSYGDATDVPVVGDWNGDHVDTVGIRRSNVFYLADNPQSGVANIVFAFGNPTDRPVTGAWNGSVTGVGVAR